MNSKGFKNFNKTASSFNPNNFNINGRLRFGLILAGVLGYGLLNSIYYGNLSIYLQLMQDTMQSSLINLLDYRPFDIVKVIISGFLLSRNLSSIMYRLDREKSRVKLLIEICRRLGFRLGYFSTQKLINLILFIIMLEKTMRIRFYLLFVTRY